ncbi:type VI secretion system-associated protein TagF [Pollutimonas harenae]|uniref:Type VI secretion system-associated protein TagF n=1 Tax=Pollutimonas harenae TaxID=657015 RepID=A0A853H0H9_9BURK|nr:type VI secretion system-associated protein TagF [Pollutimonas harenae]NYT86486.1 type VI secretion system-associated protein TagF [Pollutimonas harenae]TEA69769.1 type VI secretion system-associated protein TagF [Pollutimonas harenae]
MWNRDVEAWWGAVGWYGKMPANGDFVHRRLSRELMQWWDKWLQMGVAGMRQRDAASIEAAYQDAPLWNFAIPAGLGSGAVQLGCMGPSRDRVGRCYPLAIVLSVPEQDFGPAVLTGASGFYRQLGISLLAALRHGCNPEQFDQSLRQACLEINTMVREQRPAVADPGADILSVLNVGHGSPLLVGDHDELGWKDLPSFFNPSSHTSYWWTNTIEGSAYKSHVHGGALNATLFNKLFISHAGYR